MSHELPSRYLALFGAEPTPEHEITHIEESLGVCLPQDFKDVSSVYCGGILGGISHFAFTRGGPAANIVNETQRLRAAVHLPKCFVALAEPPGSLIVLNTSTSNPSSAVIWCDAYDVCRLANPISLHSPHTWPTYSGFFRFLLDIEEQERGRV